MAIEVDGKIYRNLPEQVEENANNIQYLLDLIASMGNIMRYKGSVATYADLPTEDNEIGDVWNIIDTGNNYAWDGEGWDEIGSSIDLSGYAQKAGIARAYDATLTYNIGDIVYYLDNIYKCNSTISTPEAWNPSHWTQIVLADETVTLSKAQVITGAKTFQNTIKTTLSSSYPTWNFTGYGASGLDIIYSDNLKGLKLTATLLRPQNDNDMSLGNSSYRYKDIYMSGQVIGASNVFNIIKVSEMTDATHFTNDQLAILTNGKPTLIDGILGGYNSCLIYGLYLDGIWHGRFYGFIFGNATETGISINPSSNNFVSVGKDRTNIQFNRFNGLVIPSNPASTGTFVLKCIDGVLTWVTE